MDASLIRPLAILSNLKGQSTAARATRSFALTVFSTGFQNALRLLSNLILTRLLFPEAFGLMGLVFIVTTGLSMFSDVGLRDSIMRQKADNRSALNTLWSLQILRGVILWFAACALSWPASVVYAQPELMQLLPVVAVALVFDGFRSTKDPRAIRDLSIGRLTVLTLSAQALGLIFTALLALWLQSVWALATGAVIASALQTTFVNSGMPGAKDRLGWDINVVWEALGYGSFIFFATIATFFVNVGSQMMLGGYIGLALFGIFTIAHNFASLPKLLAEQLSQNVLFPLYRLKPPLEAIENQRKLFYARRFVGFFGIGIASTIALFGDWLISLLFDQRYETAGPILVAMGLCTLPIMAFMGVQQSLLANGDSRRHFLITVSTAIIQIGLLVVFIPDFGVKAAIVAPMIASLLTYPMLAVFVARYKTWDPLGEIGMITLSIFLLLFIGHFKFDAVLVVLSLPTDSG